MSKSKSKSAPKPAQASKGDILTKVKGAAITKPAQSMKVKGKDIAKKVAAKKENKERNSKRVPVKEPTPEPSSEEDEEDSNASSSEDESETESEAATKVPAVKEKAGGVKAVERDESSDESESEESPSEDGSPKQNGTALKAAAPAKVAAKASDSEESDEASSSEDSGSEDDEESEDEAAEDAKFPAAEETDESEESSDESESDSDKEEEKAAPQTNGIKPVKVDGEDAASDGEGGNEDDEDSDNASDSNDSDDSEASEESDASEAEVETKPAKRKAEDVTLPAANKKSKFEEAEIAKGPNLFVGNLSWHVDEDWLRQEFEEFGELSGVRLISDRQTGRSKGYGYVEFVNAADAAKAHAAKQGAELDGRVMNVDFANARQSSGEKQDNRRKSYGDQTGEPTDTLFLGNLSFDVSQDDISAAFAPHGTILGIRLPTDRETGAPKGFGYCTFSSAEEASAALEAMQGAYISNRPVRLDYSAPRQQSGDSPARGGFGSGRGGRGGFGGRGRGGRGDFGGRGGRGGGRGGRGGSTNRGGFGDFSGKKTTF